MRREKAQENCGNLDAEGFFYHTETFFGHKLLPRSLVQT